MAISKSNPRHVTGDFKALTIFPNILLELILPTYVSLYNTTLFISICFTILKLLFHCYET